MCVLHCFEFKSNSLFEKLKIQNENHRLSLFWLMSRVLAYVDTTYARGFCDGSAPVPVADFWCRYAGRVVRSIKYILIIFVAVVHFPANITLFRQMEHGDERENILQMVQYSSTTRTRKIVWITAYSVTSIFSRNCTNNAGIRIDCLR